MKLLKPREIAGGILTLIAEADEKMIFVSPYWKVEKWGEFQRAMKDIQPNGLEMEFYVRQDADPSIAEVKGLGHKPFLVEDLHCKLYINEKQGIVTSMNMLHTSVVNAREIGYLTETDDEYTELQEFFERYVEAYSNKPTLKGAHQQAAMQDWRKLLKQDLDLAFKASAWITDEDDGSLKIQVLDRFECSIGNKRLRLKGILSQLEFDKVVSDQVEFKAPAYLNIHLQPARDGEYNLVCGEPSQQMRSSDFQNLDAADVPLVGQSILDFVVAVEKFKQQVAEK